MKRFPLEAAAAVLAAVTVERPSLMGGAFLSVYGRTIRGEDGYEYLARIEEGRGADWGLPDVPLVEIVRLERSSPSAGGVEVHRALLKDWQNIQIGEAPAQPALFEAPATAALQGRMIPSILSDEAVKGLLRVANLSGRILAGQDSEESLKATQMGLDWWKSLSEEEADAVMRLAEEEDPGADQ